MEEEGLNIREVLHAVGKRWKFVLGVVLIFTIGTFIYTSFFIKPEYEVKTKLFIGKDEVNLTEGSKSDYNTNDIQMYQKVLDTYAEIISTKTFIKNSIKYLNTNATAEEVLNNLKVTAKTNTQILELTYINSNQEEATKILQAITNKFVDYSPKLIPNVNVQIVEEVEYPSVPTNSNNALKIIIGCICGIALGMIAATILNFLDNTFETKKELEEVIGIPVLGDIPDIKTL